MKPKYVREIYDLFIIPKNLHGNTVGRGCVKNDKINYEDIPHSSEIYKLALNLKHPKPVSTIHVSVE